MIRRTTSLTSDQSGFTILETLISSGILAITIVGANLQYVSQIESEAGVRQQMQNRTILNQVAALVTNSPALFPHAYKQSGHSPAVYVACFTPDGNPMPNSIPGSLASSFVAVFYDLTLDQLTEPLTELNTPGYNIRVCTTTRGGFEVHVAWVATYVATHGDPHMGSAQVTSISLPAPGQPFKAAARVLRTFVYEY